MPGAPCPGRLRGHDTKLTAWRSARCCGDGAIGEGGGTRGAASCDAAGQSPPAGVLRRSGLRHLHRTLGGGMPRGGGGRVAVLPDAQPTCVCSWRPAMRGLRAALGEALRRYTRLVNFREGWRGYLRRGRWPRWRWMSPTSRSRPLCRAEPGAGAFRQTGRRLALVERAGAARRARRRPGEDRTCAGPPLGGVSGRRPRRRRARSDPRRRAHRPAARLGRVHRPPRTAPRAASSPAASPDPSRQTIGPAKGTQT